MIKQFEIDVILNPNELAVVFANFTHDRQAEFFNELANEVATWEGDFGFQLECIMDDPNLTEAGKDIMKQIGRDRT